MFTSVTPVTTLFKSCDMATGKVYSKEWGYTGNNLHVLVATVFDENMYMFHKQYTVRIQSKFAKLLPFKNFPMIKQLILMVKKWSSLTTEW